MDKKYVKGCLGSFASAILCAIAGVVAISGFGVAGLVAGLIFCGGFLVSGSVGTGFVFKDSACMDEKEQAEKFIHDLEVDKELKTSERNEDIKVDGENLIVKKLTSRQINVRAEEENAQAETNIETDTDNSSVTY